MNDFLIPAIVIALIAISYICGKIKKAQHKAKIAETISRGRHATGIIMAVKSSFRTKIDQVGDTPDTRLFVRLAYDHPNTGVATISEHVVPLNTPNLPTAISATGSVLMDLGMLGKRLSQMKAYREELDSQGLSKDEADKAMMDFALQTTHSATEGVEDERGYLMLTEPVEVDVYVHKSAPAKDGVHIVFRNAQELAAQH